MYGDSIEPLISYMLICDEEVYLETTKNICRQLIMNYGILVDVASGVSKVNKEERYVSFYEVGA